MEIWMNWILPGLSTFAACIGFSLICNIHGFGKVICGAGGVLGWAVYTLMGSTVAGALAAAICVGVWSEVMARLRHCPVTAYLLVALLPLVPGGGIYNAMRYAISGEQGLFISTLINTFGVAAALAVGSMFASTVFRAVYGRLPRK